ncbi:MAG: FecR domain-containing protein [Bacteroidota bacterium]
MKENNENITEITLLSYIKGTLTDEESDTVKNWLNNSEANQKQLVELKKIWKHAAFGVDFQSISAAKDWQKLKTKIKFENDEKTSSNIRNLSGIQWFVRIAAMFILFSGMAYAIFEVFNLGGADMIVRTTQNKKTKIVLTDGTVVNLNKNAQLSYPEQFDSNVRKVYLQGEGYFQVSENKEKPFVIETGNNAIIKVLGTAFNVKNEQITNSVKVHVVNGKVSFYQSGKIEEKVILTKKQQAELTKDGITKSKTININFLSWKTGILVFENESLDKVVQDLSSHYNISIVIKSKNKKTQKITSTFDNQELNDVLEEIKLLLHWQYKYQNNTIVFYSD